MHHLKLRVPRCSSFSFSMLSDSFCIWQPNLIFSHFRSISREQHFSLKETRELTLKLDFLHHWLSRNHSTDVQIYQETTQRKFIRDNLLELHETRKNDTIRAWITTIWIVPVKVRPDDTIWNRPSATFDLLERASTTTREILIDKASYLR